MAPCTFGRQHMHFVCALFELLVDWGTKRGRGISNYAISSCYCCFGPCVHILRHQSWFMSLLPFGVSVETWRTDNDAETMVNNIGFVAFYINKTTSRSDGCVTFYLCSDLHLILLLSVTSSCLGLTCR